MSTNKTEYLKMHKWVDTDFFKRSEIVENFDIIDTQLAVNAKKLDYQSKQGRSYASLLKKQAENTPFKIVCQGDSMTYGQDAYSADRRSPGSDTTSEPGAVYGTSPQAGKTYPEALQEFANKVYGSGIVTVWNRGYAGDWADRSRTRWSTNPNADVHFLMLGTNDASTSAWVPTDVQKNITQYIDDMSKLIEQILDWGSAVVLFTIPKHDLDNSLLNNAYRNALKILGEKYHVPVIDTTEFLNAYPENSVQSDATHYNTLGYTIFGAKVSNLLVGMNTIYSPYKVNHEDMIVPSLNDYSLVMNGNITYGEATTAPLGLGSTVGNGLMFTTRVGAKLTFSFFAEDDNLVVSPLFDLQGVGAAAKFQLDYGIQNGEFDSPYPFNDYLKWKVDGFTKPKKELIYSAAIQRQNIKDEDVSTTISNGFHLPKKGFYTITVENTGTVNTFYVFGFMVRKYTELNGVKKPKIPMKTYTTHPSSSDTTNVLTSIVNPYDVIDPYQIDGWNGSKSEYWKVPPLKIVVHNYSYSTIVYAVQIGVSTGGYFVAKLSQADYNADRTKDRTITSVSFNGTNLTITWGGATNRPTLFEVSVL